MNHQPQRRPHRAALPLLARPVPRDRPTEPVGLREAPAGGTRPSAASSPSSRLSRCARLPGMAREMCYASL
jgi:hypothetical protein